MAGGSSHVNQVIYNVSNQAAFRNQSLVGAGAVQDALLLQPQAAENLGKKTLVLDLDETLVHSSFKKIKQCDIRQPINFEGTYQTVYVNVRPHAEEFIKEMAKYYEIVMFTASIQKYAQPIFNKLDHGRKCAGMLYREHCSTHGSSGFMVKDLSRLNRRLEHTIIIDNSPNSYFLQPDNALPSLTWMKDKHDAELRDMMPFLRKLASTKVKDVRWFLKRVVDVSLGTKTPYFNPKKASQLTKLMDDTGYSVKNMESKLPQAQQINR
jgi:Dullard-like phosphatase family protein